MHDVASGARFRTARERTGLSQRALAKRLDVSPQAISQWEKGAAKPRIATVRKLAHMASTPADKVSVEWLLSGVDGDSGSSQSNVVYYTGEGRLVPELGDTDIGVLPVAKRRSPTKFVQTHFACSAESFALQVKGDSMEPDFYEGDVIIIDPQLAPQPGDFVFVELASGDIKLFRKYRPQSVTRGAVAKVYDLVPSNEDWPTVRIGPENKGKIRGVMSERITPRRRG